MKELIEQLLCDADVFQNMKQGGFACYLVAKRYNDAADALEKMEAENAQLRRERDAALVDMQECDGSCEFCKWYDKEGNNRISWEIQNAHAEFCGGKSDTVSTPSAEPAANFAMLNDTDMQLPF